MPLFGSKDRLPLGCRAVCAVLLSLLFISLRSASGQCVPGATYMLNDVCTACPDATMAAAGASNCNFRAYEQPGEDATATFTYTVPIGVAEIQIDAFGAKGGVAPASSSTMLGGAGGYISALVPVTAGVSLTVVAGAAPDIRTVATDPALFASLNSRLIVAGEGGWGKYSLLAFLRMSV